MTSHPKQAFSTASPDAPVIGPQGSLPWETLRTHCLLTPISVNPDGDGVTFWLGKLHDCLRSVPELGEWKRECERLQAELKGTTLRTAAVVPNQLREDKTWLELEKCFKSRSSAVGDIAMIDKIVALAACHCATNESRLSYTFIQGVNQLYKATKRHGQHENGGWYDVLCAISDADHPLSTSIHRFSSKSKVEFLSEVDRLRQAVMPSVKPTTNLSALLKLHRPQSESGQATAVNGEAQTENARPTYTVLPDAGPTPEEEAYERRSAFAPGDSVSDHISNHYQATTRRSRIGVPNGSSTPIPMVVEIAELAAEALARSEDEMEQAALCLLLVQVTLPLSDEVLLAVRCQPSSDLYLTPENGTLCVNRVHLLKGGSPRLWGGDSQWQIPLPAAAARYLRGREAERPRAEFLYQLLCPEGSGIADVVSAHLRQLKKLSDVNFPVWPSHWLLGLRHAAISALRSELMAAFVMTTPALSADGALHYFHPRQHDIERAAATWHSFLRLQPASGVDPIQAKPEDDQWLTSGYTKLIADIQQLGQKIARSRGSLDQLVNRFNELSVLCASMFVMVTASRGSRLDELRCGALLSHESLLHLEDKETLGERGPRLLPATRFSSWALNHYLHAQKIVAARLIISSQIAESDQLYELFHSRLRFDAVLFQTILISDGRFDRVPVLPRNVDSTAQNYFGVPRNFMRHMTITQWTLGGMDPFLLRALSGHSWVHGEIPSACGTYSPIALIQAIRDPLEQLLSRWIKLSEPGRPPKVEFVGLPLRRIRKYEPAYREVIEQGTQGPLFSRWHLAASVFVEQLQQKLLSSDDDLSPAAHLWLSLVCFDGLHQQEDLIGIFSDQRTLSRSRCGWVLQWRRIGESALRSLPLQVPTGLLVERSPSESLRGSYEAILAEVSAWILKGYPELETKKGKKHKKTLDEVDEAEDDKDGRHRDHSTIVVAAAALWADLHLPSIVQTAFSVGTHAPVPSSRAAERLLLGRDTHFPAIHSIQWSQRQAIADGTLRDLLDLVHRTGDSSRQLGEQKARSAHYLQGLKSLPPLVAGSMADVLDQCLKINIELLSKSASDDIQWSSVSTYMSALKPFLNRNAHLNFLELDELDRHDLLTDLYKPEDGDGDDQKARRHSAALWLAKKLHQLGHVPRTESDRHDRERPSRTQVIPVITDAAIALSIQALETRLDTSEIGQEQAWTALQTLYRVPTRWTEVAALSSTHLVNSRPWIRIAPSGFAHIKSKSSVRTLDVGRDLHERLKALASRLNRLHPNRLHHVLHSRADDPEGEVRINQDLHDHISTAVRSVIEEDFRVHNLRANAICRLLYPGWDNLLEQWLQGEASGTDLEEGFAYRPERVWHSEAVAVVAGHSYPIVSVAHYFFTWPWIRALAIASIISKHRIPDAFLSTCNTSDAALQKARQRHVPTHTNSWNHLVQLLRRKAPCETQFDIPDVHIPPSPNGQPEPPSERRAEFTAPIAPQSKSRVSDDFLFLCLRAINVPYIHSVDHAGISDQSAQRLEQRFIEADRRELERLRAREGKSQGERSAGAEEKWMLSPSIEIKPNRDAGKRRSNDTTQFERLYSTLASLSQQKLRRLLALLRPTPIEYCYTEHDIRSLASAFAGTEFSLEIVVREFGFEVDDLLRINTLPGVKSYNSVRDLSAPIRGLLVWARADQPTSHVEKARIRSIASLLIYFLLQPSISTKPIPA